MGGAHWILLYAWRGAFGLKLDNFNKILYDILFIHNSNKESLQKKPVLSKLSWNSVEIFYKLLMHFIPNSI